MNQFEFFIFSPIWFSHLSSLVAYENTNITNGRPFFTKFINDQTTVKTARPSLKKTVSVGTWMHVQLSVSGFMKQAPTSYASGEQEYTNNNVDLRFIASLHLHHFLPQPANPLHPRVVILEDLIVHISLNTSILQPATHPQSNQTLTHTFSAYFAQNLFIQTVQYIPVQCVPSQLLIGQLLLPLHDPA
jgi:hypothetical protein